MHLDEAQYSNFERWDILDRAVWPNYYVGGSYEAEIDYLKGWLVNRINWLDNYFGYTSVPYIDMSRNTLLIYPNPVTNFFTLEVELEESAVISFKIYDYMGRLRNIVVENQFYEAGRHKWTYYLGNNKNVLPSGMYYVIMELEGKPLSGTKIIRF